MSPPNSKSSWTGWAASGRRVISRTKVYSGFTSTSTPHGGQESTLLALYNSVHHFGGILVAPGYTDPTKFVDGNPYGTSHVAGQGDIPVGEQTLTAARVQAERVVKFTRAIKSGLAAGN